MASDLLAAQRAIFMSALSTAEKLVLLAIVDHWSRRNGKPFPGADRLAAMVSMHPRAVLRILRELERKGALGVQRASGRPNKYDLRAAFDGRLPVTDGHPSQTVTGHTGSQDPSPTVPGPVTDGHPKEPMEGTQGKEPTLSASQSSAAPLALTPPVSKQAANRKPRSSKKPKAKTETPDPNVTVLRDFYVQAFEKAKSAPVLMTPQQWARAMKSFKELLGATKDIELAKSVIHRALADEWQRKNGCQPWEIVRDMNKFVGAQPTRKANGRGTQPQPNYGATINAEVIEG